MNLEDYRIACGWSKNEMARESRIDITTLNRAISGDEVTLNTAQKIAYAISQRLGRSIRPNEIEGLNVKT